MHGPVGFYRLPGAWDHPEALASTGIQPVKIPPPKASGERLCGAVRVHCPDRGHDRMLILGEMIFFGAMEKKFLAAVAAGCPP
jgi:hypothetical protein